MSSRLSRLVTGRQDASALPQLYERVYGARLDVRAFGFGVAAGGKLPPPLLSPV